jgi:hypothetical protein
MTLGRVVPQVMNTDTVILNPDGSGQARFRIPERGKVPER